MSHLIKKKETPFFVVVVERNTPEPCEPDDPHCEATTHKMSHTCAAAEEHFCLGDIPRNMRKTPETSPLGLDSELLAWR